MTRLPHALAAIVVCLLATPLALAGSRFDAGAEQRPSKTETRDAVRLAEASIAERGLAEPGPVYLVQVEIIEEKGVPDRLALVTHYRTEGDLTFSTIVNLSNGSIRSARAIPHLPTALSPAEFEVAKSLARADARVLEAIVQPWDSYVVEPMTIRPASKEDPLFGHRIIQLLFRYGDDYLSEPVIIVDLTVQKVLLDTPQGLEPTP